MTNLERIIRKSFKGPQFTNLRARAREMAAANNVEALRNAAKFIPGQADGWNAIADELERQAKDKARAEATNAQIATGLCPVCGRKLRRNLSLSGWFQCSQFGAVTHRADPSQPACNWQAFQVEV